MESNFSGSESQVQLYLWNNPPATIGLSLLNERVFDRVVKVKVVDEIVSEDIPGNSGGILTTA